jgi:hypothetical protein
MTTSNTADTISTVAIAALLDVTAATITNWKSRKSDFPEPVSGNARSPLYDRRQIFDWLIANNKATPKQLQNAGMRKLAFQLMDVTRNLGLDTAVISAAICWAHLSRNGTLPESARFAGQVDHHKLADAVRAASTWAQSSPMTDGVPIFTPLTRLLGSSHDEKMLESIVMRLSGVEDLRAVHDALFDITRTAGTRGDETLPPDVAAFVAQLMPAEVERVVDPYCVGALLLMACAAHHPKASLVAASPYSHALEAALRAALIADRTLKTVYGDAVYLDVLADMRADAVISNAPWGMRIQEQRRVLETDPRWAYGTPRDIQWAVIEDAIHRLNPGGRAIALCPSALLVKGGVDRLIREGLLRDGCIEAVFSAPRGALDNTTLGFSVLVLRRPDDTADDVLLVDIDTPKGRGARPDFADAIRIYRSWVSTQTVDSERAFRVPVDEILASRGTMDPKKWREAATRPNQDALLAAFDQAQQKLTETLAHPIPVPTEWTVGEDRASRVATIASLTGLVVHRGVSLDRRVEDVEPEAGAPVLTLSILNGGSRAPEDIRYVDPGTVRGRLTLTEPGDIVAHPTPSGIIAKVWNEPGWLVGPHTELLRVVDSADFDPEYIAMCLSSRLITDPVTVGSVVPRAQVKNVEIPLLPLTEQHRAVACSNQIAELSAYGEHLARETGAMRRALADVVASGIAVSSL